MIRHILFCKYTDAVKSEHREREALYFLQKSVATMPGHVAGLLRAEIGNNAAGGDYDLIFYAEFQNEDALKAFSDHPLHVAHKERCKDLVTGRLSEIYLQINEMPFAALVCLINTFLR